MDNAPACDIAALTQRMARGDDEAFRRFHAAYFGRITRYLLVVARGDEQIVRDVLPEVFRRVVKHVRRFEQEPVFWSWLTVLARTALADERRRHRRYFSFLDVFTRHAAATSAPGTDGTENNLLEALEEQLAELPYEDRELIIAKYDERRSVREIADQLGTSEGAIESRLVRIRRKLKTGVLEGLRNESTR